MFKSSQKKNFVSQKHESGNPHMSEKNKVLSILNNSFITSSSCFLVFDISGDESNILNKLRFPLSCGFLLSHVRPAG